ncbi:helix-turn-helix transcriptional regulator [Microbacterium mangrovi]|uniref:helix-turn-helix transcriptional regulator n=1 Tax=Microbacterium mangrovi TaxID=1348253 RepID=UPI0009E0090F|nr:YafY family protein [Microbacterium mangrovi]
MADTASRVLELLGLLQTHRRWPGAQLAERLEVTERTLRRDIERLRELGYRIEAERGLGGGYRLEAGAHLPPLLLTEEEAVTIAVGLRSAVAQGLVDGEQTTLSALAKFEQLLPPALHARTNAIAASLHTPSPAGIPVAADLLGTLALACRDHERLRFAYRAADGTETRRSVEPHALVALGRSWMLLAWDRDREDWRTFRLDRIGDVLGTRVTFAARPVPGGDAAAYVRGSIRAVRAPLRVDVVLHESLERMRERLGGWGAELAAEGEEHCIWPLHGESVAHLVSALAWVPADIPFGLRGDPALVAEIAGAAARMGAGAGAPGATGAGAGPGPSAAQVSTSRGRTHRS